MKDLNQFRQACLDKNYPIMQDDALDKVIEYLKPNDKVLEIGTCVGYSSIYLSHHQELEITTLERDTTRASEARQNLLEYPNIQLIEMDALEYIPQDQFDVMLFDGAKAQNHRFLNHYKPYLKQGGLIFVDNIFFHGLMLNPQQVSNQKNLYSMVKKLKKFVDDMLNSDYDVEIFKVGDGLMKIKLSGGVLL